MVKIGELMMILDLHRQGLSVAAIARETGKDAKTIRRYIVRGLEPPVYGPRPPQAHALQNLRPSHPCLPSRRRQQTGQIVRYLIRTDRVLSTDKNAQ